MMQHVSRSTPPPPPLPPVPRMTTGPSGVGNISSVRHSEMTNARPMVYDDRQKRWLACSNGPCRLQVASYPGQLKILCRRPSNNNEIVLNKIITNNLKFNRATPTFVQWKESNGIVFGLHFADPSECDTFNELVKNLFKPSTVNGAGGSLQSLTRTQIKEDEDTSSMGHYQTINEGSDNGSSTSQLSPLQSPPQTVRRKTPPITTSDQRAPAPPPPPPLPPPIPANRVSSIKAPKPPAPPQLPPFSQSSTYYSTMAKRNNQNNVNGTLKRPTGRPLDFMSEIQQKIERFKCDVDPVTDAKPASVTGSPKNHSAPVNHQNLNHSSFPASYEKMKNEIVGEVVQAVKAELNQFKTNLMHEMSLHLQAILRSPTGVPPPSNGFQDSD